MDQDPDLDQLVTALLTASRALVGVSARSLAEVEDAVTLTQFRTMVVLRAHGPARLNRLSDRLQVNASTTLRTVERLITAGLVDRHENAEDRREVVIELTERGRRLVDDVTARRRTAIEEIVRGMPARQRHVLIEALLAFAEAADEPVALIDTATRLGW
ncbi:MAG TPA: MarR family transcriptional regulator [Nocardioides sp.]|nr:MarR family transcriptional regulator [Nocardioides sp.]